MYKIFSSLIAVTFVTMAISCSSSNIMQPGGSLKNGGVKPAAFSVQGQTAGQACVNRFLGVNWSGLFHEDSGSFISGSGNPWADAYNDPILGHGLVDILLFYPIYFANVGYKANGGGSNGAFHGGAASSAAIHQALSKVPSATYFVTASSTSESNSTIFTSSECVTVRGHALQAQGPSTKDVVR